MRIRTSLAFMLLFLVLPLMAQTGTPATPTGPGSTAKGHGQEPCWKTAGISQQAEQQVKQIEDRIRSQVESVCNDSSLNTQQKRQKIEDLREAGRKQIDGIITPQQREARKACREQRGEHVGNGKGPHQIGMGVCKEVDQPGGKKMQPMTPMQKPN